MLPGKNVGTVGDSVLGSAEGPPHVGGYGKVGSGGIARRG